MAEANPGMGDSVRVVCQEVAKAASVEEAFETPFGITRNAFYEQFEVVS